MKEEEARRVDPLTGMTTAIVAAYVWGKPVPVSELATIISEVHRALRNAGKEAAEETTAPETPAPIPAVPVKRSITPDFLICLEDGKKFKSLKRHLQTQFGMTPDEYRTKWGLAPDYPMVAPNYAATRSSLARSMGLGRKSRSADESAARKGGRFRADE